MPASGGAQSVLLPKSFAQRGIAVPFTTRVLTYARLRRPSGGSMEILIPGLAGGAEVYVVPHKMLPDAINLTVHDRAMHEEIMSMRKLTPASIRTVSDTVALTGLGGPGLAKRVKARREAEKELSARVMFGLIRIAIQQLAPNHPGVKDLDAQSIMTPAGMKLSRDALGGYAQSIGERGDKIWARLEDWAGRISEFGSPDETMKGYLCSLLHDLESASLSLAKWMQQEPVETAEMAQRASTAADNTAKMARVHVAALNTMAGSMAEPLRSFEETAKRLNSHVDQIAMILDGWSRIINMWNEALEGDRILQREILDSFAQYIPVMPIEATGMDQVFWETLRKRQLAWQRTSQQNLGSDMDNDAREKLGQFRKEPA